jgi:Family of unknown function (DUF6263)
MKQLNVILLLGLACAGVGLVGCSKPKDVATRAGAITSDTASEPVTMKLKWMTGKRYDEKMSMDMNTRMQIPGMGKPVDVQVTMGENFSITPTKSLPDGGNEMQVTFTRQSMESKSSGKSQFAFDTDNDPKQDGPNPMAPIIRKMLSGHLDFETDANGKVTKVLNYDEFVAGIAGKDPQTKNMLQGMLNEDVIKHMGQGLPDHPVKIGDHWPVTSDIKFGPMGSLKLEMKYTFKGWQQHDGHKCAVLGFVGDLASKPTGGGGPMNMSIDKCSMLGDYWYDPDSGMVVDVISEQNMDMKMGGEKTPAAPMKIKYELKLVEMADAGK